MRVSGYFVSLALILTACNGQDPPEPTTTTTTEIQYEPQPSDYFNLARVGTYTEGGICDDHTGMVQEICIELQYAVWAGWRDPLYVADYCPNLCFVYFVMTPTEMRGHGDLGLGLVQEGNKWMQRLPVVNRRCATDDRFCGRSNVRKTDYPNGDKSPYKVWREAFDAHMERANWMRQTVQGDPIRKTCPYDSIRGWCQCYGG